MKLEKCLKCGKTIPKDLRTCPDCYGKNLPDRFEKEVEQIAPKKVKREFKAHYMLYIVGSLALLGIVAFYSITYAQNAKKNQELLKQQIHLLEEANKKTPAPTPTPQPSTQSKSTTQQKATTQKTPACDEDKKNEQIRMFNEKIAEYQTATLPFQSQIRQLEAELQKPEPYSGFYDYVRSQIEQSNVFISDNQSNTRYREEELAKVKNCNLFDDKWVDTFKKYN
jgi:predicted nucleic acid-binding Zn ribbon protein